MVGDSLSADILGAQRLGIFAVWKPKTKVRERINTQLPTTRNSTNIYDVAQTPLNPVIQSENISASELPLDMDVTGDDYMLGQVQSSDYLEQYLSGRGIRPDLIIEHSCALLDLFTEVGL